MQVCCNVLWPMKLLVTTINEINQFGTYEPTVNQHTLPCVWQYCTSCHVCAHNACCFLSHIIYSFSVIYGNTQSLFYAVNSVSNSKSETWVSIRSLRILVFTWTQQGMFWAAQNTSSSSKRLALAGGWVFLRSRKTFQTCGAVLRFRWIDVIP